MDRAELIESFGRALVERVRDEAIDEADRMSRSTQGPRAAAWKQAVATMAPAELLDFGIPDIVDITLGSLLMAIDQEVIGLIYRSDERGDRPGSRWLWRAGGLVSRQLGSVLLSPALEPVGYDISTGYVKP